MTCSVSRLSGNSSGGLRAAQGEQGDLGRAVVANRRESGAHSPGDEDLGPRALAQTGGVFLSVARGEDGRADKREAALASVGVAAEDKADAVIGDPSDVVGVVLEEDDRLRPPDTGDYVIENLFLPPVITGSADAQRFASAVDAVADIGQVADTRLVQALANHGRGALVVIVIAQHGEDTARGAQSGELAHAPGNPFLAVVHEIAGEGDEIRAQGVGEINHLADVGCGNPRAVVNVGQQRDAEAFESRSEAAHDNVLPIHGATVDARKSERAASHSGGERGLEKPLDKFPAFHDCRTSGERPNCWRAPSAVSTEGGK